MLYQNIVANNGGYSIIPNDLLKSRNISPAAKIVFQFGAHRHNFPQIQKIQIALGLAKSTIQDAINQLVKFNVLVRIGRRVAVNLDFKSWVLELVKPLKSLVRPRERDGKFSKTRPKNQDETRPKNQDETRPKNQDETRPENQDESTAPSLLERSLKENLKEHGEGGLGLLEGRPPKKGEDPGIHPRQSEMTRFWMEGIAGQDLPQGKVLTEEKVRGQVERERAHLETSRALKEIMAMCRG